MKLCQVDPVQFDTLPFEDCTRWPLPPRIQSERGRSRSWSPFVLALLSLPSKATAGDYPVDASVTRSLDQSSPLLALETHLEKVSIESSHKFSPIKKKTPVEKPASPLTISPLWECVSSWRWIVVGVFDVFWLDRPILQSILRTTTTHPWTILHTACIYTTNNYAIQYKVWNTTSHTTQIAPRTWEESRALTRWLEGNGKIRKRMHRPKWISG